MKTLDLKVEKREIVGKKVKTLREKGLIPAVLYGKETKSENISVNRKQFEKVYREAGDSALIDLSIGNDSKKVLIREIQSDPVTGEHIHVDFRAVKMTEKITTDVHLEYVGEEEALAIKELEGILVKDKDTIEVECLPTQIPQSIKVDVKALKTFEDIIHVSDLKAPDGVEILNDKNEVVALAKPPRSEEELEALEEDVVEDVDKVEVEGKAEEETEEGAEEETEEGEESKKTEEKTREENKEKESSENK